MSNYIKSNYKSILCVMLAFCVIFSLFAPLSKILASADDTPAKMLYFKTSESNKRLYQRAKVEVGETYYFSFAISSDVSFTPICHTDDKRYNVNANIELISREEKGECAFYTYGYKIPEKDNNGNDMPELVFFGIRLTSACEGYFFSASVYNKNDGNKTELFDNPDFANGSLDRWAWDWDIWFAPAPTSTSNVGVSEWTSPSGKTTLKVMDFDETLIKEEEIPLNKKMLYIETSDKNKCLYQRAAVQVGETYYFSFTLSSDISFTPICRTDSTRKGVEANIQLVESVVKGKCTNYTYSYTIPQKDASGNNMTNLVFFGIRINAACEGYLISASVYNKKDESKTELFENPDFSNGSLDRWAWDWDIWFAPASTSTSNVGVSEWTNSSGTTTLKVVDLDESLIREENEAYMLHFKYENYTPTDHQNELYQLVPVTKGETYHFTFGLSNSITNFDMICRGNHSRPGIDANIQQVSKETKTGYTVYTYSYTIPDTDSVTDLVFFGVRFKEACEGYFFNASVYKADDSEKTELLTNPDFGNGVLDDWALGWKAWFKAAEGLAGKGFTKWNNDKISVEVIKYDESLFETDDDDEESSSSSSSSTSSDSSSSSSSSGSSDSSDLPDLTNKMLYIKNGSNGNQELYQRAPVTVGETYYFTFSVTDTISVFDTVCRADEGRPGVEANVTLVDTKDEYGYKTYTYSYTIPEKDKNGGDMTPSVFFGIRFPAGSEGYLFNVALYHSQDSNKTELLPNPDFSNGFDKWALGWDKWFNANDSALTEWTTDKGTTVKLVDYDESLFEEESDNPGGPTNPTDDKMLYINTTVGKDLYQRAYVEIGKTYYFTFSVTDSIKSFTPVCYADSQRPPVDADIQLVETVDEYGYKTYTYSYTIPEKDNKGNDMTNIAFFGIKLSGTAEGYFFNASFKLKDSETELFDNPDFKVGLDNWAWGWDKWFRGEALGLNEWSNDKTTLKIVDYDESLFEEIQVIEPPKQMLYINTTAGKELYQRAYVTVGETYYFTFSVSDSIRKFNPVCHADSQRAPIEANIQLVDTVDKYGYKTYTYSYTIPETDSKGNAMTALAFFGIKLTGKVEGYFFDPSIKLKDSATELFDNPDFKIGLDGWAWGWDKWFRGDDSVLREWSNDKTTLKLMDYDDSLFEDIATPVYSKRMLYIKTTTGKDLMQRIPVEIGQTYKFTFSLSNSISFFTPTCIADDKRPAVDANIELIERVDKKGYTVYTYSYTIPEKDVNGNPMSKTAFIGIKLSGTQEGYFFDPSVYKADDKNKTELFSNPDFKMGLDDWAWGWDVWFRGDNSGLDKWENEKTTLELVGYDESLFPADTEKTPKMLYINTKSPKELMQRARVKAGKTYYFTFSLNDTITSFEMICRSDSQRNEIEADIQLIEEIDNKGYTTYTYSYTIPETYINRDGEEVPVTDVIFFGVKPSIACEGYMFDVSLYKADEKYKTELFENPDFNVGLDRWAWGWDVWFGHSEIGPAGLFQWSNEKTTLKIVDFDKKVIEEINKTIPGKRMVYFINGATSSHFAARVELEPGAEYYMQFSAFATDELDMKITEDGGRQNIRGTDKELISAEQNGNYTTYLYKFIMPEDVENNLVFAGPVIKYYSEGYIFDLLLYKGDDEKKTNMWANNTFAVGLDGWIWNWHAWFGYNTDSGTTDWTNGPNTVKLVDFDLKKIDELIALLNINDGQWWDPKDVVDESALGTATLNGTLVDQNGNPISDLKLALESADNSYEAVTDSKGTFEFKDFTEGFYELYAVDKNGNNVSTGFYTTFFDGDVVTVKLVCDTSNIPVGDSGESENSNTDDNQSDLSDVPNDDFGDVTDQPADEPADDSTEEVQSVGTILGTVYTPELKTVPDLKIYIRGVGETVTDKDGNFEFVNIPVGEYEVYTVLNDGSEYIFRSVSVKENIQLKVKLKYDPQTDVDTKPDSGFNWLWVIIPAVAIIVLAAGAVVAVIIIKKKKTAKTSK